MMADPMFHHITFEARADLGEAGKVSYEDCFEPFIAFIERTFVLCEPKVITVCTLLPIPKDKGANRYAEAYAYMRSHVRVIGPETALTIKDVIRNKGWPEIYHADRTRLDKHQGAYLMSHLVNKALEHYAMDKPSVVSSRYLNDPSDQTDRLHFLYIRDPC